jgi:hypothetical protein
MLNADSVVAQVLFTDYYSNEFVIFVALAILHSHREVIIRYLVEFDEVLKYANDLSETVRSIVVDQERNLSAFHL